MLDGFKGILSTHLYVTKPVSNQPNAFATKICASAKTLTILLCLTLVT